MEQLEDYVDTVLKLKAEYKREIEIHLGLETEYYPQLFDELLTYTGQSVGARPEAEILSMLER